MNNADSNPQYTDFVGISMHTPLSHVIELGKKCSKCNNCCKYGSGFLAGDDIKNIAGFLKITENELKQKYLEEAERLNTKLLRPKTEKKGKQYGVCVFFDEKRSCTIHPAKPLQCKISTCDACGESISVWFMLNYQVSQNDPESIRQYASYLKTHPTIPGGKIDEIVPDKNKLNRILDYSILR